MSIQTTAPTAGTSPAEPTIAAQRGAFETLLRLADAHPDLPAPYVTVNTTSGHRTDLQFDSPSDFEAWRAVLGIDSRTVTLYSHGSSAWLQASGRFGGTPVQLSGHGVPRYAVASTPELLAQRHEWADPAEPPAYCSHRAAATAAVAPVVTA